MHIRLIVVSDRQPAWVSDAFDEYAKRLPANWRFRLDVVPTAARTGGGNRDREGNKAVETKAVETEGLNVLRQLKAPEQVVLLDEAGTQFSSEQLAGRLRGWLGSGSDLSLVVGGPEGVSAELGGRADLRWSLSRLTLPHGLARVVAVEQLYRAWTLLQGHPYHRG